MAKIKPMLAELTAKVNNDPNWIWETKYDGNRCLANTATGELQSRSGKDSTHKYPEIKPKTLKPAILDGEVVVYKDGKTDFNAIQHRSTSSDMGFRQGEYPCQYEIFDVLEVDGMNVMNEPLQVRKKLLKAVLIPDAICHESPYFTDGQALLEQAIANQFEGVMGKDLRQRYIQDARGWVKVKLSQTDNFVVCGFTRGTGWRASTFGALVVGKYQDEGLATKLVHVGEVGTGFNDRQIDELFTTLRLTQSPTCPFCPNPYSFAQQPTWVVPGLQIIVKFQEYTNSGMLRIPAFKGIVK